MTSPMRPSSPASEDLTWGWSVPDGAPSASPRSTPTLAPSSQSGGPESPTSVRSFEWQQGSRDVHLTPLTAPLTVNQTLAILGSAPPSGPAASPAKTSPSPASAEASASTRTSSTRTTTPTTDQTSLD